MDLDRLRTLADARILLAQASEGIRVVDPAVSNLLQITENCCNHSLIPSVYIPVIMCAVTLTQVDTIRELNRALSCVRPFWQSLNCRDALTGLSINEQARVLCFVLLANTCNRADHQLELILAKHPGYDSRSFRQHAVVSWGSPSNDTHRVFFDEMIDIIGEVVIRSGGRVLGIRSLVENIAREHIESMKMLCARYSTADAISVRQKTVGSYYKLLSEMLTPEPTVQRRIVRGLWEFQVMDDEKDVTQDLSVQVTPFVALVREFNF